MDGELKDAVRRVGDGEFRGELGRLRGELGGVIQQEFSPSFARLGEARATP